MFIPIEIDVFVVGVSCNWLAANSQTFAFCSQPDVALLILGDAVNIVSFFFCVVVGEDVDGMKRLFFVFLKKV